MNLFDVVKEVFGEMHNRTDGKFESMKFVIEGGEQENKGEGFGRNSEQFEDSGK